MAAASRDAYQAALTAAIEHATHWIQRAFERDPASVSRGAQWLFVLKHLERIADYVTNLCEQIVYMARGQVIKHTIW